MQEDLNVLFILTKKTNKKLALVFSPTPVSIDPKFEENELIAVIDDKVTIEFKEYIINNGGS
ncbi:MAG: hypothetical protein MRZ92_01860 [Lactobacillus sp.]|uniref:hypothetical protein n=1 Tax=Limosilactobacillus coleohominis TaxID=181675 RepID=UPI002A91C421|nr:hypothetical protein [Limosilactobacillus coleohominis]MCI5812260.1 hypothetical protein [Lactobacillus sp.]MDY5628756.1 hypothetical protein [Limosilactobacillus coleohominis]